MSMWFAENLGVSNEKRCKKTTKNKRTKKKKCYIYKMIKYKTKL